MAASCPGRATHPRSRRQGAVKLSSSACGNHPTPTRMRPDACTHPRRTSPAGPAARHPGRMRVRTR
ncbi:hypothetical protein HYPSUDRAFT_41747 [Hypholoma sublateritium FD-334 SS-4]|uniref:Uncharacterized protein n=1 Tax=Hypholoma sublateritium (strain FD-334 SS-4) TaxID=945553 RepID=A0A0D2NS49_HYPSF|nr:hypothetical protein HYPSUDRAFT_41747 [Hypholoma sublateritium FD-334 SS-4]